MLREIANDIQTPKKKDNKTVNDLYERKEDEEFWEGLDYDADVIPSACKPESKSSPPKTGISSETTFSFLSPESRIPAISYMPVTLIRSINTLEYPPPPKIIILSKCYPLEIKYPLIFSATKSISSTVIPILHGRFMAVS